MLKIGLIGCGGITHSHVEGWKTVRDRARIVAVADISEAAMQDRAAQIGHDVKMYTDYRELLLDPDVDAVDIALPHHLHRDAIVAAAEAGKHLMTEKPLCLTLEEAADIAAAVKASGITAMAGHNQLFFPPVQQAKQMLLRGELGKVYMIHSYDCSARRPPLSLNKALWGAEDEQPYTWRSDPALMGGGQYIDTGYHPTYRLLYLAGQMPTETVSLMGTYRQPMQEEDTATVLFKFADGMSGQVLTSWALQVPGSANLIFSIAAENGHLWAERDKLYYQPVGFQTPAVVEFPGWTYQRTFAAEIDHFVSAISEQFEPLHSIQEATDTLRMVLAAYRSTDSSRIETI